MKENFNFNYFIQNLDKIDSSKKYEFARVLYKTDNSPGWFIAILAGNEKEVTKKCKKLWPEYKIFFGSNSSIPIRDMYPINPEPSETHLTTSWIYSKYLDKWFLKGENIPYPEYECSSISKFYIDVSIDEDEKDISELADLYNESIEYYDEDLVPVCFHICITAGKEELIFNLQYTSVVSEYFHTFLERIKTESFVSEEIEEYNYIKILCWSIDNDYRVIFQDYDGHEDVEDTLDFKIPKEVFLEEFKSFVEKLDSVYFELDKQTREYYKKNILPNKKSD